LTTIMDSSSSSSILSIYLGITKQWPSKETSFTVASCGKRFTFVCLKSTVSKCVYAFMSVGSW
jgi:hypothetical protein